MREIYLDTAATTYPDPIALDDFVKISKKYPYNPSSIYEGGVKARKLLEESRRKIAESIGCKAEEIIFTSGGTEGNNMVIRGFFGKLKKDEVGVLITTQIEHPSVLRVCEDLEIKNSRDKLRVYYLPVDDCGKLNSYDLEYLIEAELKDGVNPGNILISIQAANNEIGTEQDMDVIYKITQNHGCYFHSDQVQEFPHYGLNFDCDAATVSGHKFGALRGTGFAYMSEEFQKHFSPIIFGGGQEFGLRSGTENLAGFYALANRVESHVKYIENCVTDGMLVFSEQILDYLENSGIEYKINGLRDIPVYSITFYGVEATSLVSLLSEKYIYISAGSSCHSYSSEPSHVLKAIGLSDEDAKCTIRFCWHSGLTDEDIDEFLKWLVYYVMFLNGE